MEEVNNILLVTDNRFWLNQIGSHSRIRTLIWHLKRHQWQVHIAFLGHIYESDLRIIEKEGIKVRQSLTVLSTPIPTRTSQQNAGRLLLKSTYLLLRAIATHRWTELKSYSRASISSIWLRAQEPRLIDFQADPHRRLVEEMMKSVAPNIILVEYIRLAWLARDRKLRMASSALWVLDAHDVQSARQRSFHDRGFVHDIDISPEEESRLLDHFDVIIAIQRRDQILLEKLAPKKSVALIMHSHAITSSAKNSTSELTVGFIASSMPPNIAAATELLQIIWPLVAQRIPNARLVIAGGVCAALKSINLPKNVDLLGFIVDVSDFYMRTHVVVNPVRFGGGLKIKTVEALCYGKPLVTTLIGAEGLENGVGTAFETCDDSAGFAEKVTDILADGRRQEELHAMALSFSAENFDSTKIGQRLHDILVDALSVDRR